MICCLNDQRFLVESLSILGTCRTQINNPVPGSQRAIVCSGVMKSTQPSYSNLIVNALQYTPQGVVIGDSSEMNPMALQVQDTGIALLQQTSP